MAITITKISWTRTFLEIEYTTQTRELFMYRVAEKHFVHFDNKVLEDDGINKKIRARLNVVIANAREPLSAGDWILCSRFPDWLLADEEKLFHMFPYLNDRAYKHVKKHAPKEKKKDQEYLIEKTARDGLEIIARNPYDTHSVTYTDEVLNDLEYQDRVFRYAKGKYAYTACFIPRIDTTDYTYVVLCMTFYIRNKTPRVRQDSKRFQEKQVIHRFSDFENERHNRKGNRVLFFKENGESPTSNMAAVRDRMYERGLDKRFKIVERYRNTFSHKKQDATEWLGDIEEIAKADYIFIDDYCPIFGFVSPAEGAVLTQIWHAGVGFKSVGYARFGLAGSPDPFYSPHRMYTYALVGNKYLRDIYSEVYGIEKEALLATGMPRLDHFMDADVIEAARADLYTRYPWMKRGRVVVFAPTFRGSGQRTAYYPYTDFFDMEKLYRMCERTNTYFIFEMHHFIKKLPYIPEEYQDRIIDLSHESLDALYHVSDVLVTDYSSCFYDYLLTKKPVVFYTPDRITYQATRGVQRPVEEMAPGIVCDTFDDFMDVLENSAYEGIEPDPSSLDRALEGGMLACDRVIDTILLGRDVPGVKMPTDEGREESDLLQ